MSGYIELSNGVRIPSIGFGTWQTPDGKTAEHAVSFALRNGYSHIDAAAIYGNEKGVGAGIRASGVPRERIFVTSKVWNTERGYETTRKAFRKTLSDLGLDYLDLYLIHWPANRKQFGNADDLRSFQRHSSGHDQADIARSQNEDPLADQIAFLVEVFLGSTGSIDALAAVAL